MQEEQVTYTQAEIDQEISTVNELIKAHKHQLELAEAMSRLVNNSDFKKVFMDYYQTDYLNNMVEDYASSISPELKESSAVKVQAIGSFRIFVKNLLSSKKQAEQEIAGLEHHLKHVGSLPIAL